MTWEGFLLRTIIGIFLWVALEIYFGFEMNPVSYFAGFYFGGLATEFFCTPRHDSQ